LALDETLNPKPLSLDEKLFRTEQRGCMLVTATFDADRFSVPIAISCLFGSDNKAAWDLHHDFIDEAYGRDIFDTHDRRRIFDGEKDGIISARERLSKGGVFHSLKKRAASLSEGVRTGGSFAKDTFLKAAMAPTEAKVAEYKAKMAPDAMQHLELVPDTEQYMACSGYMQVLPSVRSPHPLRLLFCHRLGISPPLSPVFGM
jgi:hypothetical protein